MVTDLNYSKDYLGVLLKKYIFQIFGYISFKYILYNISLKYFCDRYNILHWRKMNLISQLQMIFWKRLTFGNKIPIIKDREIGRREPKLRNQKRLADAASQRTK